MKKLILAGITLLLALVLITCDSLDTPQGVIGGDEEFAQYSADGKSITIRLDGGAPSRNMDRALTNALARINHDFYEVVFYYAPTAGAAPTQIARTSWARGEGAALSPFRGNDPTAGINYGSVDFGESRAEGALNSAGTVGSGATTDIGAAILLVGKRTLNGAVLLAVGTLVDAADNNGVYPGTPSTMINSTTSKVKFDIASMASAVNLPPLTSTSSSFLTRAINPPSVTTPPTLASVKSYFDTPANVAGITDTTTKTPGDGTKFSNTIINGGSFPVFMLASKKTQESQGCPGTLGACTETCCGDGTPVASCDDCTVTNSYYAGKFTFGTAVGAGAAIGSHTIANYVKGIVAAVPAGYTYAEPIAYGTIVDGDKKTNATGIQTLTVEMKNNNDPTAVTGSKGKPINNVAYITIKVPENIGGIISFNFSIPVYAFTDATAHSGDKNPILWFIQPGLENNYVDNGTGLGGSILLGIGDPSKIQVDGVFVPPAP